MEKNTEKNKVINIRKLNELINLSNLVVKILIMLLIVAGIYAGIIVLKEII